MIITPDLTKTTRLGNNLFIIISTWAYAKKFRLELILSDDFITLFNGAYKPSYDKYFKNCKLGDLTKTKYYLFDNSQVVYDEIINNQDMLLYAINNKANLLVSSYMQNVNNFDIYRNEILETFFDMTPSEIAFTDMPRNNRFVIHFRGGDFFRSPIHYIDLNNYYIQALRYLKEKIRDPIHFVIVSDDIGYCRNMDFVKVITTIFVNDTSEFVGLEKNEIETLDIFKTATLGCIIGNSTFAWWGAYINPNPDKIVVVPSRFLNKSSEEMDYKGMYHNFKVIEV